MTLIASIGDVVEMQLCTGCGVCAYIEPDRFRMGEALEFGARPFLKEDAAEETLEALRVCPGYSLAHRDDVKLEPGIRRELLDGWGPVYGVWEGHAADNEIRFAGSSGGALTALSLYCLEQEGVVGVLHTASNSQAPLMNETVISTSRDELLARTGSRYAPARPAEGLKQIEASNGPFVFIGKPCDAAAAKNASDIRPRLRHNLRFVITFFCAGTPSTKGTLDLLRVRGITNPWKVKELRYRGNGWPGELTVRFSDSEEAERSETMTYSESWAFLQKYRQWRCYICPDHTGEFADIAVGDPWYRDIRNGELGSSLIVARSENGLRLIKRAVAAGYLILEKEDASLLPKSQPNLLASRGSLWARLIVLRLFGSAVPDYKGFRMFRFWRTQLSLSEKVRSITGTIKRILKKKLNERQRVDEWKSDSDI